MFYTNQIIDYHIDNKKNLDELHNSYLGKSKNNQINLDSLLSFDENNNVSRTQNLQKKNVLIQKSDSFNDYQYMRTNIQKNNKINNISSKKKKGIYYIKNISSKVDKYDKTFENLNLPINSSQFEARSSNHEVRKRDQPTQTITEQQTQTDESMNYLAVQTQTEKIPLIFYEMYDESPSFHRVKKSEEDNNKVTDHHKKTQDYVKETFNPIIYDKLGEKMKSISESSKGSFVKNIETLEHLSKFQNKNFEDPIYSILPIMNEGSFNEKSKQIKENSSSIEKNPISNLKIKQEKYVDTHYQKEVKTFEGNIKQKRKNLSSRSFINSKGSITPKYLENNVRKPVKFIDNFY